MWPTYDVIPADIFQKLSSGTCRGDDIVSSVPDVLVWLVQLLAARDLTITQSCLCTLINICKRSAIVLTPIYISQLKKLKVIVTLQFKSIEQKFI